MLDLVIHDRNGRIALDGLIREYGALLKRAQDGEALYGDSLGWLDTEEWADSGSLARIKTLAEEIRKKADVFVLIGVGGSNNAARAVVEALKTEGGPEIIYAGNTLSPYALQQVLRRLEGKSVYVNCIAKNFETLEPGSAFRILRKSLYERYGEEAAQRIVATGTAGSRLEKLCLENGFGFLEFPPNVGGRYTAMTNVGLFPMAVAGVPVDELVRGAADMQRLLRTKGPEENIAYRYACLRNLYYRNGYRVELLAGFEPRFRYFYKWWIQLFAESEGKDGKGLFPAASEFSEELHSLGQFIQEGAPLIFETFLDVGKEEESLVVEPDWLNDCFDYLDGLDFREINRAAYEATLAAHSMRNPCITLEVDSLDPYHFGQLFYFFQFACYLSCGMMGVNAFDQPGVEAYKQRMFRILKKSRSPEPAEGKE